MDADLPSLAHTSALIRARRTVKPADMDAARTLPRELLETLLENGTWAPNHGMTEPWRFDIFEGDARQNLADQLQAIYREITPEGEIQAEKLEKFGSNPRLAPTIVACSMVRTPSAKVPEREEIEAVACALQNIQLSATAAGLGAFWSSPPLLETTAMNRFLGLRPDDVCVGLLYLGYPRASAAEPPRNRRPLAEKAHWHGAPA
ncbi:MAG: nitroreductase [Verrucomicrobiales bacterium]|nr:nitroreductase [Verrucomicrobiales bacterium]